jgi:hypothetical protein
VRAIRRGAQRASGRTWLVVERNAELDELLVPQLVAQGHDVAIAGARRANPISKLGQGLEVGRQDGVALFEPSSVDV